MCYLKMKKNLQLFIAVIALICSSGSYAIEIIVEKNLDIILDGSLSHKEWENASKIRLQYEIFPNYNTTAKFDTEVLFKADQQNLYIGIVAHDPQPSLILATYSQRDKIWADDYVNLYFDVTGKRNKAYSLSVSPLGLQGDMIESSKGFSDFGWNGIWESVGQINETGYVVELKIPFSNFSLNTDTDHITWNINAERIVQRNNPITTSFTKADRTTDCTECRYQGLTFDGKILKKSPMEGEIFYAYTENEYKNYPYDEKFIREKNHSIGVNGKIRITDHTTLFGTLNPDFSSVEADEFQFNINKRFAITYNENRPFFIKQSDFFSFPETIIHTRNIVNPDAAIKVINEYDEHSFGLLISNDDTTSIVIPSLENSTILNYDHSSLNLLGRYNYQHSGTFNIGSLITARTSDNYNNIVFGSDFSYYLNASNNISGHVLYSFSKNPEIISADNHTTGGIANFEYSYSGDKLSSNTKVKRIDKDFRADLGSIHQVGIDNIYHSSTYTIRGKDNDSWNFIEGGIDYQYKRSDKGEELEKGSGGYLSLSLRNGMSVAYYYDKFKLDFLDNNFDIRTNYVFFNHSITNKFKYSLNYSFGNGVDYSNLEEGHEYSLSSSISYQLNDNLYWKYRFSRSWFDRREKQIYETQLHYSKLSYSLNRNHHFILLIQHAKSEQNQSSNKISTDEFSKTILTQLSYLLQINSLSRLDIGLNKRLSDDELIDGLTATENFVYFKFIYNMNNI